MSSSVVSRSAFDSIQISWRTKKAECVFFSLETRRLSKGEIPSSSCRAEWSFSMEKSPNNSAEFPLEKRNLEMRLASDQHSLRTMEDDPFPRLHAMDLRFRLNESTLSPVQKLVILGKNHYGSVLADDSAVQRIRNQWWKQRGKAEAIAKKDAAAKKEGAGKMGICWEPEFEVIGVEIYKWAPTSLVGVDPRSLYSIQLFVSALLSRFLVFETGC